VDWIETVAKATQPPSVAPPTGRACYRFQANEVRLLLGVTAYNLGNRLRRLLLPLAISGSSRPADALYDGLFLS